MSVVRSVLTFFAWDIAALLIINLFDIVIYGSF